MLYYILSLFNTKRNEIYSSFWWLLHKKSKYCSTVIDVLFDFLLKSSSYSSAGGRFHQCFSALTRQVQDLCSSAFLWGGFELCLQSLHTNTHEGECYSKRFIRSVQFYTSSEFLQTIVISPVELFPEQTPNGFPLDFTRPR